MSRKSATRWHSTGLEVFIYCPNVFFPWRAKIYYFTENIYIFLKYLFSYIIIFVLLFSYVYHVDQTLGPPFIT